MEEGETPGTAGGPAEKLTLPTALALTLALSAPLLQMALIPTLKAKLPDTAAQFWRSP